MFPATTRRISDARRKGIVPRSGLLCAACVLLGGLGALWWFAGTSWETHMGVLAQALQLQGWGDAPEDVAKTLAASVVSLLLPFCLAAWIAALLGGLVQVGPLWAPKAFAHRDRGKTPWGKVLLLWIVLCGVGLLAFIFFRHHARSLLALAELAPGHLLGAMGVFTVGISLALGLFGAAIGIVDLWAHRHAHRASLEMTRDQWERERREQEANPAVRAESRRRQQSPTARV